MTTKGLKKKDSRDRVPSAANKLQEPPTTIPPIFEKDEKGRKGGKVSIPVWPEWSDQDIAAEKWDSGHRVRVDQKSRGPGTSLHFFEEPEGRIELPQSLKNKIFSWRRFQDAIPDGKVPIVVDQDSLKGKDFDLLSSSNEAVTDSELMRWIIAAVATLSQSSRQAETESCLLLKTKASKDQKDIKESKNEKIKKESDIFTDEMISWRPWHHIWPKDPNARYALTPTYNPGGKYCLKIFWMGCWRKITVDDFVPCDENDNILLPTTTKDNELWPLLLSKALVKVASLDYVAGYNFSEMGDTNIIHCLTGWLPEPIPLKYGHTSEIWNLLLKILPHWKLESLETKVKLIEKESKTSTDEEVKKEEKDVNVKPDVKETKDGKETKMKKEEKEVKEVGNKEKVDKWKADKMKEKEKTEKDAKNKEKVRQASGTQTRLNTEPEFVIFASYSPPPKTPLKISTLREMADASEKLRQFGLSHNHPHPVHVTMVRDCPLVPPPAPVPIPKWKLIRRKKKTQIVEPLLNIEPPKPPMHVQLSSPFINYKISPIPVNRVPTPSKWKRYRPETPLDSLIEEEKGVEGEDDNETGSDEAPKEGGDKIDDVSKENLLDNKKQAAEEQSQNITKTKPSYNNELSLEIVNEKEKSYEKQETGKTGAMKSNSHMKKERPPSEKSMLLEADPLEKKTGRKISMVTNKSEPGSAKGRKVPGHPKSVSDKEGKDTKEARGKLKERDLPEVVPEVEITKPVVEGNGDNIENEAEKTEENGKDGEKSEDSLWMEYDDFCLCFSTLWIFHKSQTYSFYKAHSELKNVDHKAEKSRKATQPPAASNLAATPSNRNPTVGSPSAYGSHQSFSDVPMPYLFVDSLSNIELLISFASFSRWFEPLSQVAPASKEKEKEGSEYDEKSVKELASPSVPSGVLIAEPYSWKSLVTGLPSLRIKTTGIKAALLSLPPGRHVMRFMVQAPIGFHMDICSQTSFVFGEEDVVLQHVTKESIRFTQHAVNTLLGITDIMASFADLPSNRSLKKFKFGSENESIATFSQHFQALFSSFTQTVKSELGPAFTTETQFSIDALVHETSLCVMKHLQAIEVKGEDRSQEMLPEFEGNGDEQGNQEKRIAAAIKIQSWFKGNFLRRLIKARDPSSEESKIVTENFKKITSAIDVNAESFALQMYREMFRENPGLYKIFPFHNDEWTRIAFADYNGSYPEQPINSWFIVFREIFYVHEPVLVVPKLYINIASCILRVIDNDSGEQLPMVFMRVVPRVLQKNKNGYTFVAEASSGNVALPPGKFRMRLLGASDPLPSPVKENVISTHFTTKEVRDYYVPNRKNVIFRYTAKVVDDHQVSIQVATSKPDVYIRLEILDNEVVVASANGRGHVVLPAFMFLRDHSDDDDEKISRRSSRLSSERSSYRGNRGQKGGTSKRAVSPFDKTGKKSSKTSQSPNQGQASDTVDKTTNSSKMKAADSSETLDQSSDEPDQVQTHRYIIQAIVVRDSWPLTKTQWNFISMIKQMEKTDGEATETSTKTEKHSAGLKGKKGSKESKDGKSSKAHQHVANSRPASQHFDITKPNWILRVVCDATAGEVEIKRDTERQDEIKAMKAAWEAEQPGRAAKAQQTRMKFLNENTVKTNKDGKDGVQDENDKNSSESVPSSVSPSFTIDNDSSEMMLLPPATEQETTLKPFDISPYIRSTGKSTLLDDKEEERLRMEMKERIQKYKEFRENVLEGREADRIARNLEKEKQLQEYEDMQAKLDDDRHAIHLLREQYRQKFIDQPPVDNTSENGKKRKTPSPARGRKTPRSKSPKEKTKPTKTPSKPKRK